MDESYSGNERITALRIEINNDTVFDDLQTYLDGVTVVVKNNAEVSWNGGVKFEKDCSLIIESGSVFIERFFMSESNFCFEIKGGSFVSNSKMWIKENSEVIITGGQNNSFFAFVLDKGSKMTLENSRVDFRAGANFGDECVLQIIDSELKVYEKWVLLMGENSTLDARRGQLLVENAIVELGDHSLFELSDFPVSGGHFIGAFRHIRDNGSKDFCYKGVFFSAPVKRVFDLECSFEGRWIMDAAYPQWFYDKVTVVEKNVGKAALEVNPPSDFTKYEITPNQVDWSVAINKAIEFKGSGEVHLPAGYYPIQQSIILPAGIVLKGVGDCWNTKVYYYDEEGKKYPGNDGGTYLIPIMTKASWLEIKVAEGEKTVHGYVNRFLFNCSVVINIKPDILNNPDNINKDLSEFLNEYKAPVWESSYPKVSTSCRDFSICNEDHPESKIKFHKGIFVAGGAVFEGLRFSKLQQSIVWSNEYADNKNVRRCYSSSAGDFHKKKKINPKSGQEECENEILYAYSLGFLGDAMVFENNQVENGFQMALHVYDCGGGRVEGNILNADVEFRSCKCVSFAFNHMEEGAQLRIINSNISVEGNYIWKSTRPCILISSGTYASESVVSLEGNNYIYRTQNIEVKGVNVENEDGRISKVLNPIGDPTCIYDVAIGEISGLVENFNTISIKNEYRYWCDDQRFADSRTTGIQICTAKLDAKDTIDYSGLTSENYQDFEEFNIASHFLSRGCRLEAGYKISNISYDVSNLNNPRVSVNWNNGNGNWYGKEGYYKYAYSIIYFKDRGICKRMGSPEVKMMFDCEMKDEHKVIDFLYFYPLKDWGNGSPLALIKIDGIDNENGGTFMLQLVRTRFDKEGSSYIEKEKLYVQIPVCGSNLFYDNGFSVNGFKWVPHYELSGSYTMGDCKIPGSIERASCHGRNIEVMATARPDSYHYWQPGDKIYNVGSSDTWILDVVKIDHKDKPAN